MTGLYSESKLQVVPRVHHSAICVTDLDASLRFWRDGLGFAVWDARNGLRIDLLAAVMVVIGLIGVGLDRLLVQLTRIPSVRWGYER